MSEQNTRPIMVTPRGIGKTPAIVLSSGGFKNVCQSLAQLHKCTVEQVEVYLLRTYRILIQDEMPKLESPLTPPQFKEEEFKCKPNYKQKGSHPQPFYRNSRW